jgi:pimeloyl-ACP methyl ester carboxylesterase
MAKLNIGDRQIFYTCAGSGTPTVVFESGLGDTSETWSQIQPIIAEYTQVFSYDRAGLGQSDPVSKPRTCQDMVDDLKLLLTDAYISPPYILVGHSFGGMLVRLFASQNPEDVAGMVLVDSTHEDRAAGFEKVLSEELIARNRAYLADPSRNSETLDRIKSDEQVRNARQQFDFPLVVLTRGLPDEPSDVWPSADLQRVERELQLEFLKLSPYSTHVTAEKSGHWIQNDQPELIIEAIRKVMGKK